MFVCVTERKKERDKAKAIVCFRKIFSPIRTVHLLNRILRTFSSSVKANNFEAFLILNLRKITCTVVNFLLAILNK